MQWLIDILYDLCKDRLDEILLESKAYTDQAILDAKVIPSGTIILWHSSTGTIPAGWIRCDGNNGTPDLRTKFVVGSGAGFPFNSTGGSATHLHGVGSGLSIGLNRNWSGDNLPPYHSLVYIQKQ